MKLAEEYRLVTGGRPEMYMRATSANVWMAKANTISAVLVRASDDTIQATGGYNYTVLPTEGDVLHQVLLHPHGGGMTYQAPFAEEDEVPGAGRVAIYVLAAVDVNCVAGFRFKE